MAKAANPGELRTEIVIERTIGGVDADLYEIDGWENVFGEDASVLVKWVNAHGNEVLEARRQNLKQPATLTMRYSPLITVDCRVKKTGDPVPHEIISIDDVEERHQWLEIKIGREVSAR